MENEMTSSQLPRIPYGICRRNEKKKKQPFNILEKSAKTIYRENDKKRENTLTIIINHMGANHLVVSYKSKQYSNNVHSIGVKLSNNTTSIVRITSIDITPT